MEKLKLRVKIRNHMAYVLCLTFAATFYSSHSNATSYTEAYNICSPISHQKTKEQCGWGRVYEHYYKYCMGQSGYGEEIPDDPGYYQGYMSAYRGCSKQAEFNSKEYCKYGQVYNQNYNLCMQSQGYGAGGEQLQRPANTSPQQQQNGKNFKFDF